MYIFEIFTTNLNFYVVAPNLREALNLGESVFYRVYGKKADYLDEVYRCERLDYVDEISADPKSGLGGAHSGTYFLHRQFNTSIVDPYLGEENKC